MSDTQRTHYYEVSLDYVFEHFTRFYVPPPGRHNVGKPEWIVDRERNLVVFKLWSEPDEPPAPDAELPSVAVP